MQSPGDRRASLISEAAVERGRVNNALEKLRKVEEERAQVELSASNEQRRMQQEYSLELQRRDAKIDELERLLQHAEKASSQNEVQLASSTWQQGHLRKSLAEAESRHSELQEKIRELLDQMEHLRDTLRSSQQATQTALDRVEILESSAVVAREAEASLTSEIAALKAEALATKKSYAENIRELQARLDLELNRAEVAREETGKLKSDLNQQTHKSRFEQEIRSERERDIRDRDHRVAEIQASNAMLQQRVGETGALLEIERAKVAEAQATNMATLRIKEREADMARADALQVEETLRVQLRAAQELADARRERASHDSAAAECAREELQECREQKARVEETLALALKAAAKEKTELEERLVSASHSKRLTEASEHATASQLLAAEERERELRQALSQRDAVNGELQHRLQVAAALADEEKHARAFAESDVGIMKERLEKLVEASSIGLSQPLSQPLAIASTAESSVLEASSKPLRSVAKDNSLQSRRPLTPEKSGDGTGARTSSSETGLTKADSFWSRSVLKYTAGALALTFMMVLLTFTF